MKLVYSQNARERLFDIKANYGKKILSGITKKVRELKDQPNLGANVESYLKIPNPYRFLHINQHYIFYTVEADTIYVYNIYHERENFVWKMFGIRLRTEESKRFWGE